MTETARETAETRDIPWERLSAVAWEVRSQARVHGPTRVGVAVLASDGNVYAGCNVEHRFRSHDVHAEVNALTNMVTAGESNAIALLIAAERDHFTPCGACLDWIFELGGAACLVAFQPLPDTPLTFHRADELMPNYPA
jgi:cytidine deaminase